MNKRLTILLCFFFAAFSVVSADLPEKMRPARMVNDYAGILPSDRVQVLERKLMNFNDTTSTQIAVAVVPDLEGYAPGDYATRLAEKWGIGQKGKDNGILILVKPKTVSSKGEVFIAVGYGLEGVVPDITAKRIIEDRILPAFRQNDYFGGIDAGVSTLMGLVSGEFTADSVSAGRKGIVKGIPFGIILFLLMILLVRKSSYTVSGEDSRQTSVPGMPFIFFGGGHRRGGNDDFGSFSGGGFSGFGGGSFGGGGAGGSW